MAAPKPGTIPSGLLVAIDALLAAIDADENRSGGLLQRGTLRKAGELRSAVAVAVTDGPHFARTGFEAPGFSGTTTSLLAQLPETADLQNPEPRTAPAATSVDTMTQGEIARAQGFTGDCCDSCGTFTMKRSGTCLTCANCGTTSGCG